MASTGLPVDVDRLRSAVESKYAEVALKPNNTFHFHHGRPAARLGGYSDELLSSFPERVVESFAGMGNPWSVGPVHAGEVVLDVGCGSGFDCLVGSRLVGPAGRVIGVDMTGEMLEKAKRNASLVGASNVEFRHATAEVLPVEDASVDVVISNGAINLCPDKSLVFDEIFRVLKPAGRLMLVDIVVQKEVPQEAKAQINLWTA